MPSASLVPADDPTLLFTNAGMNQFKDVFLGAGHAALQARGRHAEVHPRLAASTTTWKRWAATRYHHTFFEMLGNWSFGDYYKKEAIAWAWELLTEVWGLPKDRLWATVLRGRQGRSGDGRRGRRLLARGDRHRPRRTSSTLGARTTSGRWATPARAARAARSTSTAARKRAKSRACPVTSAASTATAAATLRSGTWSSSSTTAQRHGSLTRCRPSTWTPAWASSASSRSLQGEDSNYETDLFMPIMRRTQELLGHTDAQVEENIVAYRVIADHGRAVTFLIGDGVLPGNEGRSYVLRMILRRAARFGRKLGFTRPFLADVAEAVIETMGQHFTELVTRRDFILRAITDEEERFQRTLDLGLARLDNVLATLEDQIVPGAEAFKLYDTFGLPLEITATWPKSAAFSWTSRAFRKRWPSSAKRPESSEKFEMDDKTLSAYSDALRQLQESGSLGAEGVEHDPYTTTEMETVVIGLLVDGNWSHRPSQVTRSRSCCRRRRSTSNPAARWRTRA